ncbi:thiamine phosphate synthase [Legionella tunisiensis]|uniref:thiamine phosphate synthase n=1 Tax=Legionella tunisiensis TaxID=1034944 RepID=UPI0002D6BF1E|nr:thiamine phosphate synthase [Legionella tunisiensis]
MAVPFYKLMLVTHRESCSLAEYLVFIEQCVSAGVSAVQLREKNASPAFLLEFASKLKTLLDHYNIPLIINDDLELALAVNAQGLHLGQTDGSPQLARQRLGPGKFLGLSIETEDDLQRANQYVVDYVAASAVFPTQHKKNIRTIWGVDGLHSLSLRSTHPIIGIGGIDQHNVNEVMAAGAKGIAIIGALHKAENPALMAATLRQLIEGSEK